MQEFKKGANLNHAASMYYLGLCFRNGFGITTNIDSARHWLRKSSELNYDLAMDELMTETPKFCPNCPSTVQKMEEAINMSDRVAFDINHYIDRDNRVTINELKGNYLGYIIKYDYSKTKITEVNSLFIQLTPKDSLVEIKWYEENINKPLELTARVKNNHLVFNKFNYRRPEHYHVLRPLLNSFKSTDLEFRNNYGDTILVGNLEFFVPFLLEPQQKMTICNVVCADKKAAQLF